MSKGIWNAGEIEHIVTDAQNGTSDISLFPRRLKSGIRYYARFKIDRPDLAQNQRHITESMQTADKQVARTKALTRFQLLQAKIDANIPVKSITVKRAIDAFEADYRSRVELNVSGYSEHMLRGFEKSLKPYWGVYLVD
jgi:hypothetical protein